MTGIGAGQTLNGIDYRPATPRVLYSVSNTGQIYSIKNKLGDILSGGDEGDRDDFHPLILLRKEERKGFAEEGREIEPPEDSPP